MGRPQQRYRGVRQRHWGSWVSEIRHPLLKTRIWLGTFENAEAAARAYDEAALLMGGLGTRTNFVYEHNSPPPSDTKFLSTTLSAKLRQCQIAAADLVAAPPPQPMSRVAPPDENSSPATGGAASASGVETSTQPPLMYLEDSHVEQMIEELWDAGLRLEICSSST